MVSSVVAVRTATAADIPVNGDDQVALRAAFTGRVAGDVITLSAGQTITFGNTADAIYVPNIALALQGEIASGMTSRASGLYQSLSGINYAGLDTATAALQFNQILALQGVLSPSFLPGNMSAISGDGVDRTVNGTGATTSNYNLNKWLTTSNLGNAPFNNFSINNVRFRDVNLIYVGAALGAGATGIANPFVGNSHMNRYSTSFGTLSGNAFTGINVKFLDDRDNHWLAGGAIVGLRATGESIGTADATVDSITGNLFHAIRVRVTSAADADYAPASVSSAYLEGGGVIGIDAVSSPSVALQDADSGVALLGTLSSNLFTDIQILSNDILIGGGVVGVNNNSKKDHDDNQAKIGTVQNNVFGSGVLGGGATGKGDIRVEVGYSLRGGGVIGMNGLTNADVELTSLLNNAFAGISVDAGSYAKGGGIIGLQTNDGGKDGIAGGAATATVGTASGNIFLNNRISIGGYLEGGGVIGLRANVGAVDLGTLANNVFKGITVDVGAVAAAGGYLSGGGIVGLSSVMNAGADTIRGNLFDELAVTVKGAATQLQGGGIIGAHARDVADNNSTAELKMIDGNRFSNLAVGGTLIDGGGIIGVNNETGIARIGNVTGNVFDALTVTAGKFAGAIGDDRNDFGLCGGGVVGVFSMGTSSDVNTFASIAEFSNNVFVDGTVAVKATGILTGGGVLGIWSSDNGKNAIARIGEIKNNDFLGITVETGAYLEGGGIIGVIANKEATIGDVVNNKFIGNKIRSEQYLDGGGIIGVTGMAHDNPSAGITLLDRNIFERNTVSADDVVMGGIVYSYGLAGGMTIRDSLFLDNALISDKKIVYGTVTVDTGNNSSATHELTLTATSGNSVIFKNNAITDMSVGTLKNADGNRTNSLYFGWVPDVGVMGDDPAAAAAKLVVNPLAGGVVALYDPIWVNQEGDPAALPVPIPNQLFTMEVSGAGDFIWGGTNVIENTAAGSSVTLKAGNTTTILDGSSKTTWVSGAWIAPEAQNTMSLNVLNNLPAKFLFKLENGATLNVEGHNTFNLTGARPNSPIVDLNGHLDFNLDNTMPYKQGEVPGIDHAGLFAYQPLLTIITDPALVATGDHQGVVDLENSTVYLRLTNFDVLNPMTAGDRFYLIEVDNGVKGDPANHAFTDPDPLTKSQVITPGLTVDYKFIIDKNLDNLGNEVDTRFLVARLVDTGGSGEFVPPNTGRLTGITFLQRASDIGIPYFDLPCMPCDPCGGAGDAQVVEDVNRAAFANMPIGGVQYSEGWNRTAFGTVKGSTYRAKAGHSSHSDVRGFHFLAGFAGQHRVSGGEFQIGAFFDIGTGNYNTRNYIADRVNPLLRLADQKNPVVRGSGDLDTVGGGAFVRRLWDNGFRLTAIGRGGHIRNSFVSTDLAVDGIPARFRLGSAYWGANVGLDYGWERGQNEFNVYGRYSWLMEQGGRVVLSTGEIVDFRALNSHRATGGGRYTRNVTPNTAWYLGGAYEHEFAGSTRAIERSSGRDFVLDGPSLRGGTGIGEIGFIFRRGDRFQATLGLEGYVGKREGGSALASAMWRW